MVLFGFQFYIVCTGNDGKFISFGLGNATSERVQKNCGLKRHFPNLNS